MRMKRWNEECLARYQHGIEKDQDDQEDESRQGSGLDFFCSMRLQIYMMGEDYSFVLNITCIYCTGFNLNINYYSTESMYNINICGVLKNLKQTMKIKF